MSNAIPTDSVLQRHYDAVHEKQYGYKAPSQGKIGFVGWLKRIFGG